MMKRAREYRTSIGLDSPLEASARMGRARAGDADPDTGRRDPGSTAAGRTGRDAYKKTKDEILDALEQFDRELRPPSVPRTRARYVVFAAEHGLPSATTFTNHGGFTQLMKDMRERRHTPPFGQGERNRR